MSAPRVDILTPLYVAVIRVQEIVSQIGEFNGVPAVFTRRPVPAGAPHPVIVIGPTASRTNEDGVNYYRPVMGIDITVYAKQATGQTADGLRVADDVAERLHALFHHERHSIQVENYNVTDITCDGPVPGPSDDENEVARRVGLTVDLSAPR